MSRVLGELVPVGGGDPIPLTRGHMTVGRRESCDICLRHTNVSSTHCEFDYTVNEYWTVRDVGSSNGVKVNGVKIGPNVTKPLRPGDEVKIASHAFTIQYVLKHGAALDAAVDAEDDVFAQSLMEKAGLAKPKGPPSGGPKSGGEKG